MTLPSSSHESAPPDIWHSIYSYYTADMLVDDPDKLKMMESILTKKAPVHFEHYMGWLATRVEPLLTESRKNVLSVFPDAEKIHHLLVQLRSEGVDLSSITLSPYNSKMHVDVDDEPLASSAEECYGIEDAIRLGDEITNYNLAKIATRVYGYTPLTTGIDAEEVEHFRAWVSDNRAHCAEQTCLSLKDLDLTMVPPELASYFPNLVGLYLERNDITSISLTGLSRLQTLNLSSNQLTSVSLKELPQLFRLNLSGNKLTSVNLRDFPQLNELHLCHNRITSINLRELPRLLILNLANNQLGTVVLKTIERVQGLPSSPSMSQIYLSMHDLNVALQQDARAEIIKKYNEIKRADYPDMRATWSDEFLTQRGYPKFDKNALLKATMPFLLERLDGVTT